MEDSRIYGTLDEVWYGLVEKLLFIGDARTTSQTSRDGDVHGEIIGCSFILDASKQSFWVTNPVRNASHAYGAAETLWYLSGTDETRMLERYAPSYKRFAEDGRAYGAYGPRISPQLPKVIRALRDDPSSRQAVIAVWSRDDLERIGKVADMPCTLSLQFLLRDHKLHCVTTMRSNDVWLGLPYDVFAFCCVQRLVAAHLDAEPGLYHHRAGSMHLYSRNAERAREAMDDTSMAHFPPADLSWQLDDTLTTMQMAIRCEHAARLGLERPQCYDVLGDMGRWLVDRCSEFLSSAATRTSRFDTRKENT